MVARATEPVLSGRSPKVIVPGGEAARGLALPAGGPPAPRYRAVILLQCTSASGLSEAIGVLGCRSETDLLCLAERLFTFAFLMVIWIHEIWTEGSDVEHFALIYGESRTFDGFTEEPASEEEGFDYWV